MVHSWLSIATSFLYHPSTYITLGIVTISAVGWFTYHKLTSNKRPLPPFEQAVELLKSGNEAAAAAMFKHIFREDPEAYEAVLLLVGILFSDGNFAEAITLIDDTLSRDQQPPPMVLAGLLAARAEILSGLGKSEEANADLERAIQIDPQNLTVLLALATAEVTQKNFRRAHELLDGLLSNTEDNSFQMVVIITAKVGAYLDEGWVEEALVWSTKCYDMSPSPLVCTMHAECLQANGKVALAELVYGYPWRLCTQWYPPLIEQDRLELLKRQ